jgi:hypothetical protein
MDISFTIEWMEVFKALGFIALGIVITILILRWIFDDIRIY